MNDNLDTEMDDDRIEDLSRQIAERIAEFTNEHHSNVSINVSDSEVLSALVSVMHLAVASIGCPSCRGKKASVLRKSISEALRHAVNNPVHPDSPSEHVH